MRVERKAVRRAFERMVTGTSSRMLEGTSLFSIKLRGQLLVRILPGHRSDGKKVSPSGIELSCSVSFNKVGSETVSLESDSSLSGAGDIYTGAQMECE